MSDGKLDLTPEQEQRLAAFLVGLNQGYLSLDLSRQALFSGFSYSYKEANTILYQFRDRHFLLLATLSSGELRWFYVAPVVDALLGIGWMSNHINEQNRQSTAAIQSVISCADDEATRIRHYLESLGENILQRVSNYTGPGKEENSLWKWQTCGPYMKPVPNSTKTVAYRH